jgi:hypothetical protein
LVLGGVVVEFVGGQLAVFDGFGALIDGKMM